MTEQQYSNQYATRRQHQVLKKELDVYQALIDSYTRVNNAKPIIIQSEKDEITIWLLIFFFIRLVELYAKAGVAPPSDLMPAITRPKTEPLIHVGDPNDIVIKVIKNKENIDSCSY